MNLIFLKRWYIGLAGLSTIFALVAIVFPRWPKAEPLNAAALNSQLKASGLRVQQQSSRSPTRTFELSSSEQLIWKLPNDRQLSLMRATSREYSNFQLAFLTRAQPSLQLKHRQLITKPLPLAIASRDHTNILQTCIATGRYGQTGIGVTGEQLSAEQGRLTSSKNERIFSFLVMNPLSRNGCVIVTLSSPHSSLASDLSLFQDLIRTITPGLGTDNTNLLRSLLP